MTTVEGEARRALSRLSRALEKSRRELESVERALRPAEAGDFPEEAYTTAAVHLGALLDFVEQEAGRLQDKILTAGGLEPGRIRRSSSSN